jgi:hypothetical protein
MFNLIYIALAHCNNRPQVDMSAYSDILCKKYRVSYMYYKTLFNINNEWFGYIDGFRNAVSFLYLLGAMI